MAIIKRLVKGSALTHSELDNNLTELVATDTATDSAVAAINTRVGALEAIDNPGVVGGTFVSDGAGGGSYVRVHGFNVFADTATTNAAPSQVLTSGVESTWTIDGGLLTIQQNPSDAVVDLWNPSTNRIQVIALNDLYTVRIDFIAEGYVGNDKYIELQLHNDGGAGDAVIQRTFSLLKNGTAVRASAAFPIRADAGLVANGGRFGLTLQGGGTCNIHTSRLLISRDIQGWV